VKENIRFVAVSQVSQVLDEALIRPSENEMLTKGKHEDISMPEMPKSKAKGQPIMEKV